MASQGWFLLMLDHIAAMQLGTCLRWQALKWSSKSPSGAKKNSSKRQPRVLWYMNYEHKHRAYYSMERWSACSLSDARVKREALLP